MSLYSVMLVDDEEDVRQAIAKKLDWEQIGFQVVGNAENGEEALELAEQLRPDVVMTDIKMPFMDGLTFCRRLKESQMSAKIVIFSGFDEFEYAKEAITLEVEEYILKPINAAELRSVFERIKITLNKEIAEKRNVDQLNRYYQESLPVMRDQFLSGLVEGRIPEETIEQFNDSYELNLQASCYSAAVIQMDCTDGSGERLQHMMAASGKQILDEHLHNRFRYRSVLLLDRIVVVGMMESAEEISRMIYFLDQICKICKRVLSVNTTAGIGQVCTHLAQLHFSYEGAVSAFESRILLEPNQAIYIKDIEPNAGREFVLEDNNIQRIIYAVKLGSREELKSEVEELIQYMKGVAMTLNQYQIALMEMVTEILKFIRAYGVEVAQVFGEGFDLYKTAAQFDSLDALGEWLENTLLKLRSFVRQERKDTAKLLIERAIQYIEQHYADSDLSVETLCSYLNVSSTYFSSLFKKETRMGFVAYLTNRRMEQAVYLLDTTDQKTYMISDQVGYTEPNYFSYVFKKHYGIAPSRYRVNVMEQNEK